MHGSNVLYQSHFLATFLEDKDIHKIDEMTTPEELSGLLNLVLIALNKLIKDGHFAHIEDIGTVRKLFEDNRRKAYQDLFQNSAFAILYHSKPRASTYEAIFTALPSQRNKCAERQFFWCVPKRDGYSKGTDNRLRC